MQRLKHISIEDNYRFSHSKHIANACFGKNYKGWFKATLDITDEQKDAMLWFPKLAVIKDGIETAQDQVYGCINTVSEDGRTIYESHSSEDGQEEYITRYVFAKPPGDDYRYIGNFIKDNEASTSTQSIYRRTGTELDLTEWVSEPVYPDSQIEYYKQGV